MKKLLYLFLAVLVISCETDITDRFNLDHGPRIAVASILEADSIPSVYLTETITLNELDSLKFIRNARVYLIEASDTNLLEETDTGYYCNEDIVLKAGSEYQLICKADGLPDASVQFTLPVTPDFSVNTTLLDDYILRMDIQFSDDASREDFYTLSLNGWQTNIYNQTINDTLYSDTINDYVEFSFRILNSFIEYQGREGNFREVGEDGRVYMAHFSDHSFNGTNVKLSMEIRLFNTYNDSIPEINVELIARDFAFFRFNEIIMNYDPYPDIELLQPPYIYSNIENGFGLLTASSRKKYVLDMSSIYLDKGFLNYRDSIRNR